MNKKLAGIVKKAVVGCIAMAAVAIMLPSNAHGAEKRILEKEYADCQRFDVTSYGADKTGAGDSTAAFQKAVDYAKENSKNGAKAVIYVPSGTYTLNAYVVINETAYTIVCEDDTVIKSACAMWLKNNGTLNVKGGKWENKGDNTKTSNNMFQANAGTNLHITDAALANSYRAVFTRAATATLQNVTISGAFYAGAGASEKSTFTADNTVFTDCKMGVLASGKSRVTFNKITVQNCPDIGLQAIENSTMTVNESQVINNGSGYKPHKKNSKKREEKYRGHGIAASGNATIYVNNTTVEGNNQCGVSLSKGNVVVDNNCYIANNGRQGIGTDKKCKLTVKNSTIHHNGYNTKELKKGHNGIVIQDGSKGVVENCTISKSKNTGIWVSGKGSSLKIKNSILKGNKIFSISVETSSGRTTFVSDNCTYKNSKNGVSIVGNCKFKAKGKNKFKKTGGKRF